MYSYTDICKRVHTRPLKMSNYTVRPKSIFDPIQEPELGVIKSTVNLLPPLDLSDVSSIDEEETSKAVQSVMSSPAVPVDSEKPSDGNTDILRKTLSSTS